MWKSIEVIPLLDATNCCLQDWEDFHQSSYSCSIFWKWFCQFKYLFSLSTHITKFHTAKNLTTFIWANFAVEYTTSKQFIVHLSVAAFIFNCKFNRVTSQGNVKFESFEMKVSTGSNLTVWEEHEVEITLKLRIFVSASKNQKFPF